MNATLLQSITIIDTLLIAPLGEGALPAIGFATGLIGIVTGTMFAFSSGTQLISARIVLSAGDVLLDRLAPPQPWRPMLHPTCAGSCFSLQGLHYASTSP